jgi:hypothetical protein
MSENKHGIKFEKGLRTNFQILECSMCATMKMVFGTRFIHQWVDDGPLDKLDR